MSLMEIEWRQLEMFGWLFIGNVIPLTFFLFLKIKISLWSASILHILQEAGLCDMDDRDHLIQQTLMTLICNFD